MALSMPTRVRMGARQSLSRVLTVVPVDLVGRIRDTFVSAAGPRRRALTPVAAILRHRPLAPLETFTVPGGTGLRLCAVESRLARLIYWYGDGGYERGETACWRRLCAGATSIVEIGANIGYYTVQGAQAAPRARYVAIEANPESAGVLRRNLALNGLDRVEVIVAAVVGELDVPAERTGDPGWVRLALPDQERYLAPTGAYLRTGTEGITDRPASRTIDVRAVAALDVLATADLVKLDIEGAEGQVLDAVRPVLAANRPTIVVEVLKDVPRLRRLIADLHADGYLVLAIGATSLHLLTADDIRSESALPRFGSRDVVLLPAERASRL
ncbi:MAG: FkbM family methyltransferase [Frankia sp.]